MTEQTDPMARSIAEAVGRGPEDRNPDALNGQGLTDALRAAVGLPPEDDTDGSTR